MIHVIPQSTARACRIWDENRGSRAAFAICRAGLDLMDRDISRSSADRRWCSAQRLGNRENARLYLERAIEVQQPIAAQDPLLVAPRQFLLRTHGLLGALLLEMERTGEALEHIQFARSTADELLSARPAELLHRHDCGRRL